ncbi:unnamed protein product [Eruca vesicaria subsp. sativa]|uniref:Histone deacetylase interacting domain-containing protein n=1 Tax=Eruca vesicaria subsp. sativa TaxID=29727 RepID=A0ABC8KXS2_ERUVS|nr:unnamed protein product [Eruca vesicaria subsp. sativa]
MEDDSEAIDNLRETIKMSLSPSAMITYDSLVQDFTLDRIGVTEMTTSLRRLLEKDEFLHQRFLEATNELKQEQEDANGETQDVKVDEIANEESNPEADLENHKEDATLEITPSYDLIPEEERSLAVPETVLNNEFRLVKVKTPGSKKLTGYKKEVAEYEDERYLNDMMIEYLTSAVELWEKVMRNEMRKEDVGEKFYTCIEELDRGGRMIKKLRQNYQEALPMIVYRLKKKLAYLIVTRETKNSRWKQIESTEKARSRKQRRLTI